MDMPDGLPLDEDMTLGLSWAETIMSTPFKAFPMDSCSGCAVDMVDRKR